MPADNVRVLQLGRFWTVIGGVQLHAQALSKGLASLGIDVVNIVASATRRPSDQTVDGYRLIEAASWGVHFSTAISPDMVHVARQLHRSDPFDLLHLHFPDPMSHLVSLALPAHLPRVITWHSDIVRQKYLLKLYRPWQRREILRAKAVVAPTDAHFSSSRQIPEEYPCNRRHVIPFGMDYSRFDPTPAMLERTEKVRQRAQGQFLVFALGRHVEYKGFGILLEAMCHSSSFLVLGGEGPLTADLKAKARQLGVADRVWFTGTLSDAEVAACYHACDIFCLPSITTNEAFGLVQLEAMACGKPVICTELGNGVNALNPHGITGLTVPVGNAVALGQAIESLRSSPPLLKQLGEQARRHVFSNYSMEAMSRQHADLYCLLMQGNSASS